MPATDPPQIQPQLRARPQARAMTVDELVDEARTGRVRVPEFQRDLKWDAADALKLLDSIDRGYPVGTLLFWQREADAGVVSYGARKISAPARSDTWFVIDGQQRLTALMRTLYASEGDPWRVDYDLARRTFVPHRRAKPDGRLVPVDVVFDQTRLLQWLVKEGASTSNDDRLALFDLTKRLQKYQLPVVVVEARSDEEDAIRDIFTRLNEAGKRLDVNETFRAFHEKPGVKTRSLDVLIAELSALSFGTFDRDLLINLLATTRGVDPGKLKEALKRPEFLDDDALPTLHGAIAATVQFLQTDCAIVHLKLVPYAMVLQPLVRFFQIFPAPQPRTRELLRRYVWRGSIQKRFRTDVANTRAHVDAVKAAPDEHHAVQALLGMVSPDETAVESARSFSMQNAAPRMETSALLALGPRSLIDGRPLVASGLPFDAALLPPVLMHPDLTDHGIWARVVYADPEPTQGAVILCSDADVLASHGLSIAATAALARGDHDTFIAERKRVLAPLLAAFFARMAAWSPADRDRPPLHVLRERATAAAGSGT